MVLSSAFHALKALYNILPIHTHPRQCCHTNTRTMVAMATWCSVSCPRTFYHVDCRCWGSNRQPDIQGITPSTSPQSLEHGNYSVENKVFIITVLNLFRYKVNFLSGSSSVSLYHLLLYFTHLILVILWTATLRQTVLDNIKKKTGQTDWKTVFISGQYKN